MHTLLGEGQSHTGGEILYWCFSGGSWEGTHLPIQEMRALFLGQEDRPGEEMATDSSTLAWEIAWTEEPDGLRSTGPQSVERD